MRGVYRMEVRQKKHMVKYTGGRVAYSMCGLMNYYWDYAKPYKIVTKWKGVTCKNCLRSKKKR